MSYEILKKNPSSKKAITISFSGNKVINSSQFIWVFSTANNSYEIPQEIIQTLKLNKDIPDETTGLIPDDGKLKLFDNEGNELLRKSFDLATVDDGITWSISGWPFTTPEPNDGVKRLYIRVKIFVRSSAEDGQILLPNVVSIGTATNSATSPVFTGFLQKEINPTYYRREVINTSFGPRNNFIPQNEKEIITYRRSGTYNRGAFADLRFFGKGFKFDKLDTQGISYLKHNVILVKPNPNNTEFDPRNYQLKVVFSDNPRTGIEGFFSIYNRSYNVISLEDWVGETAPTNPINDVVIDLPLKITQLSNIASASSRENIFGVSDNFPEFNNFQTFRNFGSNQYLAEIEITEDLLSSITIPDRVLGTTDIIKHRYCYIFLITNQNALANSFIPRSGGGQAISVGVPAPIDFLTPTNIPSSYKIGASTFIPGRLPSNASFSNKLFFNMSDQFLGNNDPRIKNVPQVSNESDPIEIGKIKTSSGSVEIIGAQSNYVKIFEDINFISNEMSINSYIFDKKEQIWEKQSLGIHEIKNIKINRTGNVSFNIEQKSILTKSLNDENSADQLLIGKFEETEVSYNNRLYKNDYVLAGQINLLGSGTTVGFRPLSRKFGDLVSFPEGIKFALSRNSGTNQSNYPPLSDIDGRTFLFEGTVSSSDATNSRLTFVDSTSNPFSSNTEVWDVWVEKLDYIEKNTEIEIPIVNPIDNKSVVDIEIDYSRFDWTVFQSFIPTVNFVETINRGDIVKLEFRNPANSLFNIIMELEIEQIGPDENGLPGIYLSEEFRPYSSTETGLAISWTNENILCYHDKIQTIRIDNKHVLSNRRYYNLFRFTNAISHTDENGISQTGVDGGYIQVALEKSWRPTASWVGQNIGVKWVRGYFWGTVSSLPGLPSGTGSPSMPYYNQLTGFEIPALNSTNRAIPKNIRQRYREMVQWFNIAFAYESLGTGRTAYATLVIKDDDPTSTYIKIVYQDFENIPDISNNSNPTGTASLADTKIQRVSSSWGECPTPSLIYNDETIPFQSGEAFKTEFTDNLLRIKFNYPLLSMYPKLPETADNGDKINDPYEGIELGTGGSILKPTGSNAHRIQFSSTQAWNDNPGKSFYSLFANNWSQRRANILNPLGYRNNPGISVVQSTGGSNVKRIAQEEYSEFNWSMTSQTTQVRSTRGYGWAINENTKFYLSGYASPTHYSDIVKTLCEIYNVPVDTTALDNLKNRFPFLRMALNTKTSTPLFESLNLLNISSSIVSFINKNGEISCKVFELLTNNSLDTVKKIPEEQLISIEKETKSQQNLTLLYNLPRKTVKYTVGKTTRSFLKKLTKIETVKSALFTDADEVLNRNLVIPKFLNELEIITVKGKLNILFEIGDLISISNSKLVSDTNKYIVYVIKTNGYDVEIKAVRAKEANEFNDIEILPLQTEEN